MRECITTEIWDSVTSNFQMFTCVDRVRQVRYSTARDKADPNIPDVYENGSLPGRPFLE